MVSPVVPAFQGAACRTRSAEFNESVREQERGQTARRRKEVNCQSSRQTSAVSNIKGFSKIENPPLVATLLAL